jgi:hypothetical protein
MSVGVFVVDCSEGDADSLKDELPCSAVAMVGFDLRWGRNFICPGGFVGAANG